MKINTFLKQAVLAVVMLCFISAGSFAGDKNDFKNKPAVKEAEKLKAIPHDAEFIHRVFLYHMRLNGVEIVKAIE